jgi:hypothetical protein
MVLAKVHTPTLPHPLTLSLTHPHSFSNTMPHKTDTFAAFEEHPNTHKQPKETNKKIKKSKKEHLGMANKVNAFATAFEEHREA